MLQKYFQHEKEHSYFMIRSDLHYISFPNDENVLSCIVSAGHFCRLDTALHPVNRVQEGSFFCLKMIRKNQ